MSALPQAEKVVVEGMVGHPPVAAGEAEHAIGGLDGVNAVPALGQRDAADRRGAPTPFPPSQDQLVGMPASESGLAAIEAAWPSGRKERPSSMPSTPKCRLFHGG